VAEWASIDIDALVSALAPLEVESGVDVEKRNEVVYLQVVVFEIVSMVDERHTCKPFRIVPDHGRTCYDIEVKILGVLPNIVGNARFLVGLLFIAKGRHHRNREQAVAGKGPVVGISETDAVVIVFDFSLLESRVNSALVNLSRQLLAIVGYALVVIGEAQHPRAAAAALHSALAVGSRVGEVSVIEHIVGIERKGVGIHAVERHVLYVLRLNIGETVNALNEVFSRISDI